MTKVAPIDQRKADHIKINLEQDVRSALSSGLENYRFIHEALPELDLDRINTKHFKCGKLRPIFYYSQTLAQYNLITATALINAARLWT